VEFESKGIVNLLKRAWEVEKQRSQDWLAEGEDWVLHSRDLAN
jgi:hypothetical protein